MRDLNGPVENSGLVAALERVAHEDSEVAKDALLLELQRADYLVAVLSDEMHMTPTGEPGRAVVEKDSFLKVIHVQKDGKSYLPLFSDWAAIRAHTNRPVDALVMPAKDAWSFALKAYDGVVINPPHNALPLERGMLLFLQAQSASTQG